MSDYDTIRENYDYSLSRVSTGKVTNPDLPVYTDEDGNTYTIDWVDADNEEMYCEQISIGGLVFTATVGISTAESADVPTHRVENGFEISDHIDIKPTRLSVKLQLIRRREELEQLMAMYVKKQLVEVITGFGKFNNMAIADMQFDDENSINTYPCSLSLIEIKYAKVLSGVVNRQSNIRTDAGPTTSAMKTVIGKTAEDGTTVTKSYIAKTASQNTGSVVTNMAY